MIVVFGLGTRLRVCMRTKLENDVPDPSFSLGMNMHKYNLQTIFTYALIGCCQALVILSLAGLITIYGKVCYPHQ